MGPTITTEGVVLGCVKYGEGCVIVNILTSGYGRQGYMVKVTGVKRKTVMPLLQPLTLVEIEAYNNPKATVQKLKEVHLLQPLMHLPFDPIKRSIAMFLAELVGKSVRNEMADWRMYEYVKNSVLVLDEGIEGLNNFHLYFMWKLMTLLGFEPDMNGWDVIMTGGVFDMENGVFTDRMPLHKHVLRGDEARLWTKMSEMGLETLGEIKLNRVERQQLISWMETFYMLHIPGFNGLNSAIILGQLN